MTVRTFFGAAGCGKTFQLMLALQGYLDQVPLQDGQKVLALTFMHGSRRRLDDRLASIPGLLHKYECATIDSFAWRIVRRWKSLADQLGYGNLAANAYEEVVGAAATLLEIEIVAKWVARAFPILLVDEAQDLNHARLRIIAALSSQLELLAAADEFQCLDDQLRPNPACDWLANAGPVENLVDPKRTDKQALLGAANAIRSSAAPTSGGLFVIVSTPSTALAGTWLSHALAWYGNGKNVAIITPTDGPYARSIIDWVAANKTNRGLGPFQINWEQSESRASEEFLNNLILAESMNISHLTATIQACGDYRVITDVLNWIDVKRRAGGQKAFKKDEIESVIKKSFSDRRRGQRDAVAGFRAMTVHGAKNREFDNVIVLWPAAVIKNDDQNRRLLYNAITRAKERCLVLVQIPASLRTAPFA